MICFNKSILKVFNVQSFKDDYFFLISYNICNVYFIHCIMIFICIDLNYTMC